MQSRSIVNYSFILDQKDFSRVSAFDKLLADFFKEHGYIAKKVESPNSTFVYELVRVSPLEVKPVPSAPQKPVSFTTTKKSETPLVYKAGTAHKVTAKEKIFGLKFRKMRAK